MGKGIRLRSYEYEDGDDADEAFAGISKMIQEKEARIGDLEDRVKELESEVESLTEQLEAAGSGD